ncbi:MULTISPECIES: class C beta-lactamase [Pseudomonas]|uniref:Beta-lactamase n=1 Tax=Pseudomonas cichorii TaxID=36746 RepID=A0A3M4VXT3_PSECI|nr:MULTISPECIES: class C beta-lactamase [Pseudomonas]AHF68431.1 AmpC protein [Pseudomonas cichorii JBC1]QVE15445.1 beta-lactamase [Pseudomonas cichorii]RMR56447.1 AmpC protein [Pseudomonas cichorii]SDO17728.1 beta-lactamase class C [Pseudomonas cichorii]GFM76162.1 beta-lactamase [Pseudomonas cichorii]
MQWIKACAAPALLLMASSVAVAESKTPALDKTVHDAISSVMQQYNIPGMAIAITENGQRHFYDYGVSSRDIQEKVSNDTLFELGSISKLFTATLATWAQANGQLSLTASIDTYIPQLYGSRLGKVPLFHLGTHTAGGFPLQFPETVRDNEQMMSYFKAWQPQYLPGAHRSYANPSIGLLGMIAADRMKRPFNVAMEQHLFPALGMTNSYLDVPANRQSWYAQGYNRQDAAVRLNPGVLAAEAYGMKSGSGDLIRFVEANMGMVQTSPALQRALADTRIGYFKSGSMTQDLIWEQYDAPLTLDALLEGNSSKMAYETQPATALNPPLAPRQNVWINKTGSTNGFGGYIAFVPARKLGIVILANKNYPNEARVRIAYRILSELDCCSLPKEPQTR